MAYVSVTHNRPSHTGFFGRIFARIAAAFAALQRADQRVGYPPYFGL
ncbi:hypothetical protein ACIKTA_16960 [Hansschlegelia beijingensis]